MTETKPKAVKLPKNENPVKNLKIKFHNEDSDKKKKSDEKKIRPQKTPEQNMDIAIKEGASFSVMDGFTANFITPFAIALNASNSFISFLATLPSLIAAFLQLSVGWLLKLNNKRKFWIMAGVFLQALTWLPLALIPHVIPVENNHLRLCFVFAAITLNAIFAAVISPFWISMMGDIVPQHQRGEYFGKRNSITGFVAFISTFIAGFTLNYFSPKIGAIAAFSIIFAIALIARLISVYFFTRMDEPVLQIKKTEKSNIIDFIKRIKKDHYGIFVLYLCALGFAVSIASPFFSVYMLRELKIDYTQFTILASASIIASFLSIKSWGKFADRYGTKNIMLIGGILISFVPLFWMLTTNFYLLFLIEIFSGLAWAGFNIASSNYIYDATDPENRTKNVTYLNILKGLLVFSGAALGGFLTTHTHPFGFKSTIILVFFISFLLRLAVSVWFFTKIKEARLVEVRISKSLFQGSIMINPRNAAFTYNHPKKIENESNRNINAQNINEKSKSQKICEKTIPEKDKKMIVETTKKNLAQHFRTRSVNLKEEESKSNKQDNKNK